MNETETRLTAELKQEADAVQPDLDRMWSAIQERTREGSADASVVQGARPWRRRAAPYVAAASVAAVLVTVAVVNDHGRGPSPATRTTPTQPATPQPSTPQQASKGPTGPVDLPVGDWACPDRTGITPRRSLQTYELPMFFVDPREVPDEATDHQVPRYHFTIDGNTGVLDYGDAEGRRISQTKLIRAGDRWRLSDRTVCSGADGRPSPNPVALGKYTEKPLPFEARSLGVQATPPTGTPLLVDDRTYFDGTGQLHQTTLYAYPAKGGYAFARMPADDSSYDSSVTPENRLGGDSAQVDSRDTPFGAYAGNLDLILSYLTKDQDVTGLRITSSSGRPQGPAQKLTFPGGKTLYTAIARSKIDGDTLVTVLRKSGNEPPRRY
ncbi:hypothetical protein [Streptomyces sp. SID13031]|uniref:hypothetical protein n=1 Tax=Streptomyces sp. SID13031 TaxID=2706046 RepID=UPI0013C77F33|nr:hypothetical protein [Streptomyces sp. SID13031]NEA34361.1 hypothetical protein [Streptomyces sp. SID13031]